MYNSYENKSIGYIGSYLVYYDKLEGYAVEEQATGLRNPTKKELELIKAKFGDLELKL
jgi:hypothetical protein